MSQKSSYGQSHLWVSADSEWFMGNHTREKWGIIFFTSLWSRWYVLTCRAGGERQILFPLVSSSSRILGTLLHLFYWLILEKDRWGGEGQRERESSRLPAECGAPHRARSQDPELMTRAKIELEASLTEHLKNRMLCCQLSLRIAFVHILIFIYWITVVAVTFPAIHLCIGPLWFLLWLHSPATRLLFCLAAPPNVLTVWEWSRYSSEYGILSSSVHTKSLLFCFTLFSIPSPLLFLFPPQVMTIIFFYMCNIFYRRFYIFIYVSLVIPVPFQNVLLFCV